MREIALAVILTIAAAGFITVGLLRGDFTNDRATPYAAARKVP